MVAKIRVAIAGIGNCASSLVQGIEYYRQQKKPVGLSYPKIGPYSVSDIEIVAAFDIDKRKVGKDLSEAIFQEPNNTRKFVQPHDLGVKVSMTQPLDGISPIAGDKILLSDSKPSNPAKVLADSKAELLVNLTPTGATRATEMYAKSALQSKSGFINATPARIASSSQWQSKYKKSKLPLVGDDIMDQIGSTILHKNVLALLVDRGLRIGETYQLDIGGGTESQLALDKKRYEIKRNIKTSSVAAAVPYQFPIVAGSSDFVDFMENRRTSYFNIKGEYFGGTDFSLDMRLSLEDGPACAAVVTDVIRMTKLARDRGESGPLTTVSAYGFKAPPKRLSDQILKEDLASMLKGTRKN
ncbi:inositol-3-phosphate synthase [Candidatus Bathyarchaeota archaeon]|nr:inositol-3-phosphate synthase [Candidatus Bathyarchaeota archaeon]